MAKKSNKSDIEGLILITLVIIIYIITEWWKIILISFGIIVGLIGLYFIFRHFYFRNKKQDNFTVMPQNLIDSHNYNMLNQYQNIFPSLIGFGWNKVWHGDLIVYALNTPPKNALEQTIQQTFYQTTLKGQTETKFINTLEPLLLKLGYNITTRSAAKRKRWIAGNKFISSRRLKLIYDINFRMAQTIDRWVRIQENKHLFPYLQYIAVLDERTRKEHRRWHNLILPVEHPFWKTHYPPNGWKCRCMVRQISAREAQANGGVSADPVVNLKPWVNKKTGETLQVPEGIAPGFENIFNSNNKQ